jgi:hypothetical protein
MALALVVTWADVVWAGSARDAALRLHERLAGEWQRVWFQGHWGFQYYMQELGARPFNFEAVMPPAGDVLVVPTRNTNAYFPAPGSPFVRLGEIEVPTVSWLATMDSRSGAGFYANVFGPAPYVFGRPEPSRYVLYRRLATAHAPR